MPDLSPAQSQKRVISSALASAPAFEQAHLISYIQLADAKAAVFLAIASGAIAYVAGHYGLGWIREKHFFAHTIVLLLTTTVLLVSAALNIAVILPRRRKTERGVTFYHDVARIEPPSRYVEIVQSMSDADVLREQFDYCHALARICAIKYRLLYYGFVMEMIGYAIFLGLLLWW